MSLGYEGYVKLGSIWMLGTGSAVPQSRVRVDSTGAYAGKVVGASDMGIGAPHVYDWTAWDGSVDFEMTEGLFDELKSWIISTRDDQKSVLFSSRYSNVQQFDTACWNNITISASEASLVTGSLGFVAFDRTTYTYGTNTPSRDGSVGNDILILNPIPYWSTKVGTYKFVEWTLTFSQDVVKLFACNRTAGPQGPAYYGVGPMTVAFSGSYILGAGEFALSPADQIVTIGTKSITLKKVELQNTSDDVAQGNTLTPIKVELAAYEVA